jgi:hypothetical protein
MVILDFRARDAFKAGMSRRSPGREAGDLVQTDRPPLPIAADRRRA